MAETVQASQQDGYFNESIVNEEILEDMKKNRIDHMKYLPDMEQLEESDVMDQVISAMNAYDYDKYTEADVRRALAHDNRTPEDFKALLSGRNRTGCKDRNKETFRKQYLHVYTDLHCELL